MGIYKDAVDLIKHLIQSIGVPADLDYLFRTRVIRVLIPADAAAADASKYELLMADKAMTITNVDLVPGAALTADDTDYKTLTLGKGDNAGGALTSLAAKTTKITGGTGNWAEGAKINWLATRKALTAGQRVALDVAKTGNGVVVPDTLIEITVEYD